MTRPDEHDAATDDPAEAAASAVDLVHRLRAGDQDAENELVERYSRGILFFLRRLTRDPALADDLHQETFRLVLEKTRGGELREPEKLSAFVHQVARNLTIAEFRRRTRHRPVDGSGGVSRLPHPEPGPLRHLLAKEHAALVRRLLDDLDTDRDREILFHFFVAEKSKEAICAALGLSSLHFNRVLHRARQRLKDLVARHQETPSARGADAWTM
ncbi:MAG: sigma-70 family RNA polymerase sigma factor [Acidobacteriota bacterium]